MPQIVEDTEVNQLACNPLYPRRIDETSEEIRALAESIRRNGMIEPIRANLDGTVVTGHRRLIAARIAGRETVPVIFNDLDRGSQLIMMLDENSQHEELTPLEQAKLVQKLLAEGIDVPQIARATGTDPRIIRKRLRLLELPQDVQELVGGREIPINAIEVLAKMTNPDRQRLYARMIAARKMSVRGLERRLRTEVAPASKRRGERLATVPARAEAIEQLEKAPDREISQLEMIEEFERFCCACGLKDCGAGAEICAECPLPQFLTKLAAGGREG